MADSLSLGHFVYTWGCCCGCCCWWWQTLLLSQSTVLFHQSTSLSWSQCEADTTILTTLMQTWLVSFLFFFFNGIFLKDMSVYTSRSRRQGSCLRIPMNVLDLSEILVFHGVGYKCPILQLSVPCREKELQSQCTELLVLDMAALVYLVCSFHLVSKCTFFVVKDNVLFSVTWQWRYMKWQIYLFMMKGKEKFLKIKERLFSWYKTKYKISTQYTISFYCGFFFFITWPQLGVSSRGCI